MTFWRSKILRISSLFRCPSYSCYSSRKLVLGIETSCDDTAAAVVDDRGNVLSNVSHSQLSVHLEAGGILPIIARDLHNEYLDDVVYDAIVKSGVDMSDISLIAVTNRPGLPLSLLVGLTYAKKLALKYKKPLIPVHHMEAHATIASMLNPELTFPFLCLLLSGGHAQLAFFKNYNRVYLLGQTMDNAPGEVMDKIARRLRIRNFGPPFDSMSGGQAIEVLAAKGEPKPEFTIPVKPPLHDVRDCNFSFSGFKSIIPLFDRMEKNSDQPINVPLAQVNDIAASILHNMTRHIVQRLNRAIQFVEGSNLMDHDVEDNDVSFQIDYSLEKKLTLNLVVSGGVAANDFIIDRIKNSCDNYDGIYPETKVNVFVPRPKEWCGDNGVMIAWNGLLHLQNESESILRREEEIEQVGFEKDAKLGIDISKMIIDANIKTPKINILM